MKITLRFLVLAIMTSSWIAASALEYHIQEGFDGSTPNGWTTVNTYNGSSDNNGVLEGEKAIKMKATYSEVVLPSVVGAGTLSFYIKPNNTFADASLLIQKSNDNGTTWETLQTIKADSSILTYEKQVLVIDDSESVIIKFLAEGGAGTSTLFMLDDVELTKLAAAEDDAQLASLTMNGIPVEGFSASILDYNLTINFTTKIPQFEGITNHSSATATATQLTNLQGNENERTATIKVLAADGVSTQTYTIVVTVSSLHIETGFGDATASSMSSTWNGWDDSNIYITSSVTGPGNHAAYDGTAALKFMNKNEGDAPFIKSPAFEKIKTLSFYLFVEDPRAGSPCKLKIETITDSIATELVSITESELTTDSWTKFSFDLNITENTNILFTPTIIGDWDGDMSTKTRLWMDDLQISADSNLGLSVDRFKTGNSTLKVYPNPVSEMLNINTGTHSIQNISLINALGSIVYSSQSNTSSINMNNYDIGIYILQIKTELGVSSRMIIKK